MPADPHPVTALIADEDALARLGLRTVLRPVPEISVVGETADAASLPGLIAAWSPDVLVVDHRFRAEAAAATLRRVPPPRGPTLVVVAPGSTESVIVPKAAPGSDIIAAIVAVSGRPMPPTTRTSGLDALTPREAEVLGLVAQGLTNDEIRELLDLSLETVRTHLKHIYAKCGVSDRTHAVIAAYRGGLVAPPEGRGRRTTPDRPDYSSS